MTLDAEQLLGATMADTSAAWDDTRVILYHLGLGAGDPPTDPGELRYVYEDGLVVLPSFGVIPAFGAIGAVFDLPGFDADPALLLHGEHEIRVHRPIPTSGAVTTSGTVSEVWDKGSAAVVTIEAVSSDADGALVTNRAGLFVRGAGGFGGESGPSRRLGPPARPADVELTSTTLPQQALIYRLASGDRNPLHADPGFARLGGFDRPILHGLATYGIVLKAVVDGMLDGGVDAVRAYRTRFAGVVFPGETIVTRAWRTDAGIALTASTAERGEDVLTDALVQVT